MDRISDFDFEVLKLCIKENDRKSFERLIGWLCEERIESNE